MKSLAICGITNSGKTATTQAIICELTTRGYKVGSIKYIHCENFTIDPDLNEDTSRHRAAGSQLIAAHANTETSLMFTHRLDTNKLLSLFQGECDWLVCEGVSDIPLPTIVTAHTEEDLLMKLSPVTFAISGVISATMDKYNNLPVINALTDITALVDLIEKEVVTAHA